MLLIVISWIYIFFTTINFGYVLNRSLKLKTDDFSVISVLGLFSITILTTLWAIIGRINVEFHIALLVVNAIIFLVSRRKIISIWRSFKNQLWNLPRSLQLLLGCIALLIIAQCASSPYLVDNESYYIQSIKWLNEYGLVKGLGNLHLFFAQASGWHITQSAFSFSFLYKNFNDLSGFCLLLGNIFALLKLDLYFRTGAKSNLIIGLLPICNVLLFQFISAPSPDIPVFIISFMIFYIVLDEYKNMTDNTFNLITLLVLFIVFIKATAIGICFIPLILLIANYRILLPKIGLAIASGLIVLLLFMTKNIIISGYPLFPVTANFIHLDYAIPQTIASLYYRETAMTAYFVSQIQYEAMSPLQRFITWISLPKLHGLFNLAVTILLVISPLILYKFFNKKQYWVIYFTMAVQMFVLFLSSPQYRFFLHFVLFFSFLTLASFFYRRKFVIALLSFGTLITAVVLFIPIGLNAFTKNKFAQKTSNFSVDNIIFPHKNSKSATGFMLVSNGNLNYYSPMDNEFFYSTGDGQLPCVNKDQVNFFEKYYLVYPQMRTHDLKDGFIAKQK